MTALATRGDMILPVLQAADADRLSDDDRVLLDGCDVTDLVEAMYHSGLLHGQGTDSGDRWVPTGAGRVLRAALEADPSLTEVPS